MSKGWDNATLKKLKALTGKGLSTSEIGKRLGMSKNAIVGKLNRMGWNAKAGGATVASATVTEKNSKTEEKTPVKATAKKATVTKTTTKKVADSTPKKTATVKKPAEKVAEKKSAETAEKKKTVKEVVEKSAKKESKTTSKTSAKDLAMHQRIIQHSLEMANLKPNQCRWPIGDPDSEHFHFCGETVFVGKPYCYEHCKQAYQFTPPKKK